MYLHALAKLATTERIKL